MEENVSKLGIMDFFNVLLTGALFVICANWIYPIFWNFYISIDKNYQSESRIGVIVLFFGVGLILQEAGSYFDSKVGHIKDNVLENFLKKDNAIINNKIKLDVYREHGKKILKCKGSELNDEFSPIQCKFIYAYCLYYIENKEKSSKYEKMRGLFDFARTMIASSLLLLIGSCIMLVYNLVMIKGFNLEIINIIQIFLFGLCTSIFYGRAKRIMSYKARMLMQVYDVCIDVKKKET